MRSVGVKRDTRGEHPLYTVLDWNGDERLLNSAERLSPLPAEDPVMDRKYLKFCIPRPLPASSELRLLGQKVSTRTPYSQVGDSSPRTGRRFSTT